MLEVSKKALDEDTDMMSMMIFLVEGLTFVVLTDKFQILHRFWVLPNKFLLTRFVNKKI